MRSKFGLLSDPISRNGLKNHVFSLLKMADSTKCFYDILGVSQEAEDEIQAAFEASIRDRIFGALDDRDINNVQILSFKLYIFLVLASVQIVAELHDNIENYASFQKCFVLRVAKS